jgi:hypothetical protein
MKWTINTLFSRGKWTRGFIASSKSQEDELKETRNRSRNQGEKLDLED